MRIMTGTIMTRFFIIALAVFFIQAQAMAEGCGGGCGGEEGGGDGSQAAAILSGIAQIIAAISPMVVAGIQADADKTIAKINADAQITMTKMSADVSKELAKNQKDIALEQANVAKQINQENNDSTTQRLNMQLAELRSAREENLQLTRERRDLEKQYNDERIELAKKQADDQLKLAKATLSAQLTQAGLSTGFANSRNSTTRLDVGTLTPNVRSNSGSLGTSAAGSNPSLATATGVMAASKGETAGRLLANLKPGSTEDEEDDEEANVRGLKGKGKGKKQGLLKNRKNRGLMAASYSPYAGNSVGNALYQTLAQNISVRGSFRGLHNRTTEDSTDLKKFFSQTQSASSSRSFAEALGERHRAAAERMNAQENTLPPAGGHAPNTGAARGAYKPPQSDSVGRARGAVSVGLYTEGAD